jgi:hypothetical protein
MLCEFGNWGVKCSCKLEDHDWLNQASKQAFKNLVNHYFGGTVLYIAIVYLYIGLSLISRIIF